MPKSRRARYMRGVSVEERFWAKVDKTDSCWEWTATRASNGYGAFNIGAGKIVRAHRFAYELLIGPIPDGLHIDHLCRNRACVNPAHMEVVTNAVNTARGEAGAHNSAKDRCPQGHEYSRDNTYLRANGARECRICRRARSRQFARQQAAAAKLQTSRACRRG